MKKISLTILLFFSVISVAQALELQQVIYKEADLGTAPQGMRLLVDKQFLRIDGGSDKESFILLDRANKQIISVNHEDRTVIYIQPQQKKFTAPKNQVRVESQDLPNSPAINGVNATAHMILSNETLCRQVVSFKGLLPKVTQAWSEYEAIIQSQNRQTLYRTPQDMRTHCFMTNNITHATLFLNYGLPFSVKSSNGNLKILQNYSNVTKGSDIFEIPKNYQRINL